MTISYKRLDKERMKRVQSKKCIVQGRINISDKACQNIKQFQIVLSVRDTNNNYISLNTFLFLNTIQKKIWLKCYKKSIKLINVSCYVMVQCISTTVESSDSIHYNKVHECFENVTHTT